jgi:hypothetical protein
MRPGRFWQDRRFIVTGGNDFIALIQVIGVWL